jgi:DnaK suppressor protein
MPRSKPKGKGSAKSPLTNGQLAEIKKLLLRRREQIRGNVKTLGDKTIGKNPAMESGDVSRLPMHMADVGSDVFEHDLNLNLVESEVHELEMIEEALERFEKGGFGRCEHCRRPIPAARLKAMPHARLCITCKQREEGE